MFRRIVATLWGNFESAEEVKKFGLLGLIFGLIIGCYWAFRPIKDSIFSAIVGVNYTPYAKFVSMFVIVPLIIIYGKLIDMYPRHKVFYALTSIYALVALFFAWGLGHETMGLYNTVESPARIIGWAWYVYVESFGSLVVALFWAFTTDITDDGAAKRGFPLVALLGQTGNILGPLFLNAKRWGFQTSAPVIFVASGLMFLMAILMWVFMQVTPKEQLVGYENKEKPGKKQEEPGFLDGLKLLLTKPYLLGIFLILTIYEIVVTIFDFFMKSMSKAAYPAEVDHAQFLTKFAVTTGIVATLCVLFGINSIQRFFSMRASLTLLPILVAVAVVGFKFNPTLTMVFWIMVVAKAINYALNQPTLKQLYIPTTKDVRYKSQSWIETFGSRASKAGGSGINALRLFLTRTHGLQAGQALFLTISSGISLGLIVIWLFVVMYVAKTYQKAVEEKSVVC